MSIRKSFKLNQFIQDHLVTSLSDESCCSRVTEYEKSSSGYSTKNLVQKIQQLMQTLKKTQYENMSLRIEQAELRKQLNSTKNQVVQQIISINGKKNKCEKFYSQESIKEDFMQKNVGGKGQWIQNGFKQQCQTQKNTRKWSKLCSLQQVPQEGKKIYRSYLNSPNKQQFIESKMKFNLNNKQLKMMIESLQLSGNANSNQEIFSPRKAGSISKTRRNNSQSCLNKYIQQSNHKFTDSTQRILNKNRQKSNNKQPVIPNSIQQIWNKAGAESRTTLKCGTRKVIKKNIRKSYLE